MNGIVMLKKSSVKTGFFISSENYLTGEKFKIYKIPKISRNVMKRLIKKLKRDNIKALAVDDNFKEEQILLLKENFEIADINKALLKNISRIIKKYAKSRGYTDGKIKVGILCDISLNILTDAKREIGCIYVYNNASDCEEFYKKTGIPVIKKKMENDGCRIMIMGDEENIEIPVDTELIIETGKTDIKDSRCIADLRFENEGKNEIPGIKNAVINHLLKEDADITGFIKKTLDTIP